MALVSLEGLVRMVGLIGPLGLVGLVGFVGVLGQVGLNLIYTMLECNRPRRWKMSKNLAFLFFGTLPSAQSIFFEGLRCFLNFQSYCVGGKFHDRIS